MVVSTAALAAPFDARRCTTIRDVEVPYEIRREGAAIVFSEGKQRIVVSERAIVSGAARLDDPALAGRYAASLRGFMTNASRLPIVSARFGGSVAKDREKAKGETPGFLGALRDMCQSLLEVSEIQSRIAQVFPAFVAPVRVTLAK
jgi:hypothetical protein